LVNRLSRVYAPSRIPFDTQQVIFGKEPFQHIDRTDIGLLTKPSCCWDGRAMLHKSIFRLQVGVPLFNARFISNLLILSP